MAGQPTDSQNCVCFTETPLEHVNLLTGEIEERNCQFGPDGLIIPKGGVEGTEQIWFGTLISGPVTTG
jgi:hypothetical protein